MIREIERNEVLSVCSSSLGVPIDPSMPVPDEALAALVRRAAGINCPCSRSTLRASIAESLQYLDEDAESLPERLDHIIEGLIVSGDLLELNDVSTGDVDVNGTWVFAAPPAFVARPEGSCYLLGVVPDQDSFLPDGISSRVTAQGYTRLLKPETGEDIEGMLSSHGLQHLSSEAWLRSPKAQSPEEYLSNLEIRLKGQGRSGAIAELQVIDHDATVRYYKGRWTAPSKRSGIHVGRRPQMYGAPLWCMVELEDGEPQHLLDLPLPRSHWRGCDEAWRVQIAFDSNNEHPQEFRTVPMGGGLRFDFFSPIPKWVERRLMVFGQPLPAEKCLFSYLLPISEADEEIAFLRDTVWLEHIDELDEASQ